VDRGKLPAPEWGTEEGEYVGPRTVTEELVAGIFTGVLKRERVGVKENFFKVGGHSLLATQVISRIRTVFQVELPLRVLFESPTIEKLAVKISEIQISVPPQRAQILPLARERFRVASSSKELAEGVKQW
jgi:hypothetical protein